MTIDITYKNTNRFVMMAGSLDDPASMKEVLDFMDPLGVSVVESGSVTVESLGDEADVTIQLRLGRASAVKTSTTKKRKTLKRKPRKKKNGAAAASYSEPPEGADADGEPDDDADAAAHAQRLAKAQAAAVTAQSEHPGPPDEGEDAGDDPLGDLADALGMISKKSLLIPFERTRENSTNHTNHTNHTNGTN